MEVFDVLGRRVAVLIDGMREAGYHDEPFDVRTLAAGSYVVRIRATSLEARRTEPFIVLWWCDEPTAAGALDAPAAFFYLIPNPRFSSAFLQPSS